MEVVENFLNFVSEIARPVRLCSCCTVYRILFLKRGYALNFCMSLIASLKPTMDPCIDLQKIMVDFEIVLLLNKIATFDGYFSTQSMAEQKKNRH